MKRSGLFTAVLAISLVAGFAVKAGGWFQGTSEQKAARRVSLHDAERWYRTGQEKHWRCFVLQAR